MMSRSITTVRLVEIVVIAVCCFISLNSLFESILFKGLPDLILSQPLSAYLGHIRGWDLYQALQIALGSLIIFATGYVLYGGKSNRVEQMFFLIFIIYSVEVMDFTQLNWLNLAGAKLPTNPVNDELGVLLDGLILMAGYMGLQFLNQCGEISENLGRRGIDGNDVSTIFVNQVSLSILSLLASILLVFVLYLFAPFLKEYLHSFLTSSTTRHMYLGVISPLILYIGLLLYFRSRKVT